MQLDTPSSRPFKDTREDEADPLALETDRDGLGDGGARLKLRGDEV